MNLQAIKLSAVEITTVIGCKVRCSYCPQPVLLRESKLKGFDTFFLTEEIFSACLSRIPRHIRIHFSGYAEPFLNRNCIKFVQEAVLRGHEVALYTTGVGMTVADVPELERLQPSKIYLHLPDNEGLMNVKVDKRYLDVLRAVRESSLRYGFKFMGTLHPQVGEIFSHINPEADASTPHTRAGNVEDAPEPTRLDGPIYCAGQKITQPVLLPNGDLQLCCFDYGLRHKIGNLLSDTWEEVESGSGLRDVLEAMALSDGECLCRTCEFARPVSVANTAVL